MTARRVLWVTTGLGRGGTERLLVDTAARLDHADNDVTIAYVLPWKNALRLEAIDAGAEVTCVGVGRPPLDPRWIVRLVRLVRRERWDIVHTHAPLPAAVARLAARSATRVVHTEHNVWDRYRLPTRLLNAATWRRNDRVVAVSDGVAASIRPRSRHRPEVEVVVQGIDSTQFRAGAADRTEARHRMGVDDETIVIGTVGNLVGKKDHATLLHAAASMALPRPIEVVIAGTGPLESELRALASELGVSVTLLGMRDDVPALLPGFDVFCLSSRFEGLPIALLEAMAAARPVVATAVGGVPQAITDGQDGLLVPAGDRAALASALTLVLEDRSLADRLGAAARDRSTMFGIDRAVTRTAAIYDELDDRSRLP
jgi:glycosyltransferase involved in cell wall biosynthesis